MDKFQSWQQEIEKLSENERIAETNILKTELHNLELRLFIHSLINQIKNLRLENMVLDCEVKKLIKELKEE